MKLRGIRDPRRWTHWLSASQKWALTPAARHAPKRFLPLLRAIAARPDTSSKTESRGRNLPYYIATILLRVRRQKVFPKSCFPCMIGMAFFFMLWPILSRVGDILLLSNWLRAWSVHSQGSRWPHTYSITRAVALRIGQVCRRAGCGSCRKSQLTSSRDNDGEDWSGQWKATKRITSRRLSSQSRDSFDPPITTLASGGRGESEAHAGISDS